jgi:hypothetical protein
LSHLLPSPEILSSIIHSLFFFLIYLFVDNSSNSKGFIRALDNLGTLESPDHSSQSLEEF